MPPGNEYIYSKCRNKYLPEFICKNRKGKLFKNNNNNKETSHEIIEWLILLAGPVYFCARNNKQICNELYLFSVQ